jgi:hypothetical protein
VESGGVQGLIGVDIPKARDERLIQEKRLQGS